MSKKIAFLLASQFEDSEMKEPYDKLKEEGHEVVIVGLKKGELLTGKNQKAEYTADQGIDDVKPDEFDAVVIPGGSSPEALRMNPGIQNFVKKFDEAGKTIAAICHGPQILMSADLLKGRTLTSYPPLQDDVQNAGGKFVDEEVVVDKNLITSRTPKDEPAFIAEIKRALQ
ncbi:type 1 glutamine amidotransferase domain-containing protein [Paenibacillus lutrae]|uniref:DJ-1/PfpI/YhbO family deglycase/protease n=1 Tax=Paenibacillus lutrae TaxID=2078573 RepID=A0A7X3FN48_9BACL|nr:type 1 glutamine amidotransferase domain-containing protein [Paenibacillus lutrae]MVP02494.1 DJ-1/PfpI/YhbO family deglycase/protease [Paenibacillus lutrae]